MTVRGEESERAHVRDGYVNIKRGKWDESAIRNSSSKTVRLNRGLYKV